jgi:hypothetical protein
MQEVHSTCQDYITAECSKAGHKVIGYDYDTTELCVADSFNGKDYSSSSNDVLAYMKKQWQERGAGFWPSVMINNKTFRGDVIADSV